MPTVDYVDLERFSGDWYVIANIPTFIEKGAHNAVESYTRKDATTIDTTFSFNQGSFDGKRKVYTPTGYVRDTQTNAVWDMQFIWPFVAEYRIVYLNQDYSQTVIGRSKRDYVWIMARTPTLPQAELDKLIDVITRLGYDRERLEMVPQDWSEQQGRNVADND
jgi:apolipoprotein D and lipocalin family protein